jgi:hypothetical protein
MTTTSVHPIHQMLEPDHVRLNDLRQIVVTSEVHAEHPAYRSFRAGLLRHIAMEEKLLLQAVKDALGHPHPLAERLRTDHSLLATLLIPPPTLAILKEMGEIMHAHHEVEEKPGGFFDAVEQIIPEQLERISHKLEHFPGPTVAIHQDTAAVWAHIADLRAERLALLRG